MRWLGRWLRADTLGRTDACFALIAAVAVLAVIFGAYLASISQETQGAVAVSMLSIPQVLSLLIAGLSLVVALLAHSKSGELISKQVEAMSRAAVVVYLCVDERGGPDIYITNRGQAVARDVKLEFPEDYQPAVGGDLRARTPVPFLSPGQVLVIRAHFPTRPDGVPISEGIVVAKWSDGCGRHRVEHLLSPIPLGALKLNA